jgi:hypothetical protein
VELRFGEVQGISLKVKLLFCESFLLEKCTLDRE